MDWRSFDLSGTGRTDISTYHCMEEGWYLQLPENWIDRVEAERTVSGGEAAVIFYAADADGQWGEPVLRIAAVTGTNREARAARGNRVILRRQKTAVYTAELMEANGSWEYGITMDEIQAAFSLIATEWTTGDN